MLILKMNQIIKLQHEVIQQKQIRLKLLGSVCVIVGIFQTKAVLFIKLVQ